MRLNGLGIIRLMNSCGLRRSVVRAALLLACMVVVQVALWNGAACAPASAQKVQRAADGFPGVGSHEAWSRAALLYNQSIDLRHSGHYGEALSMINKAINVYPNDDAFYQERGLVFKKSKEFGMAEKDFRKAISMNPSYWGNWNNLGRTLGEQDRLPEAKTAFVEALKRDPSAQERIEIEKSISFVENALKTAHP